MGFHLPRLLKPPMKKLKLRMRKEWFVNVLPPYDIDFNICLLSQGIIIRNFKESEALLNVNIGGIRFVFRIDTLILRNTGCLDAAVFWYNGKISCRTFK